MRQDKPAVTESIIVCVHCDQKLWTLKILAQHAGKPQSTEWVSWNPDAYKGHPKSWECPLCHKDFATQFGKTGQYKMKMIDTQTGKLVVA